MTSRPWEAGVVLLSREPALTAAALGALVNLAVAFGWNLSPDQVTAVNAVLFAAFGVAVRRKVTPA